MAVSIRSGKVKVTQSRRSQVFRHFCRTQGGGSPRGDVNVKLSLIGRVIALRRKRVRITSRLGINSLFQIQVPGKYTRLTPRRVGSSSGIPNQPFRGLPVKVSSTLSSFNSSRFRSRVTTRATVKGSHKVRYKLLRRGAHRKTTTSSKGEISVLITRSGATLQSCLQDTLRGQCGISATQGKRRTCYRTVGRRPSLILASVIVPKVSKVRLYHGVGRGSQASTVKIVLLATRGLRGCRMSKCHIKTSTCMTGPFSLRILFSHVSGLITQRGGVRGGDRPVGRVPVSRITIRGSRSLFLIGYARAVRARVTSPQFSILRLYHGVNISQSRLCQHVLTLAKLAPVRFVHDVQLGRTTSFLTRSKALPIGRMVCHMKCAGLDRFTGVFRRRFKLCPGRFTLQGQDGAKGISSTSRVFSGGRPRARG